MGLPEVAFPGRRASRKAMRRWSGVQGFWAAGSRFCSAPLRGR